MFCHLDLRPLFILFLLILFLFLYCALSVDVYAENFEQQTNSVLLFSPGRKKIFTTFANDKKSNIFVDSFWSPSLVSANGVVVALSAAFFSLNKFDGGLLAKYIWTEESDWARKLAVSNGNGLGTYMVARREERWDNTYCSMTPLAVAKGDKIYLLVLSHTSIGQQISNLEYYDWEFELAVGEIKSVVNANGVEKKTIEWRKNEDISTLLTEEFKNKSLKVPFFDVTRSAFLTDDGKIVFSFRTNEANKKFAAIVHAKETGNKTEWGWSYVELFDECLYTYFYFWKGKINMLPTLCNGGSREVKVSSDMGKTWTNTDGVFSRLWNNSDETKDFTPATINNKTVLLFTQPITSKFGVRNNRLMLWFFDGVRIFNAGPIVSNFLDIASGSSLLYTNGELFSLYQILHKWRNDVFLADHRAKVQQIKSVLSAWSRTDAYLSRPCNETTLQNASSFGSICLTPMPTNGLIGFLSDNISKSIYLWHDEYFYRGAIVKGGKKVTNGFLFDRPGAGAKWEVGTYWRQHGYNFGKDGLTLVATVAIHNVVSGSSSPLLTVDGSANGRRGLYCSGDKTFKVVLGQSRNAVFVSEWETDQTYRVALLLGGNTSNFSAHVIGGSLYRASPISASFGGSNVIESVFIGDYEDDGGLENAGAVSNLTVTNVFLYNRLLSGAELNALGERS